MSDDGESPEKKITAVTASVIGAGMTGNHDKDISCLTSLPLKKDSNDNGTNTQFSVNGSHGDNLSDSGKDFFLMSTDSENHTATAEYVIMHPQTSASYSPGKQITSVLSSSSLSTAFDSTINTMNTVYTAAAAIDDFNSGDTCYTTTTVNGPHDDPTTVHPVVPPSVEELIRENNALREKLKEICSDRDRLLCEVANLKLELDMAELKRLPEESFPQKVDRSVPGQYALQAPGSISSSSSSVGGVGGYVYLQQHQHYAPPPSSSQHVMYQQHSNCHPQTAAHQHHLQRTHHNGNGSSIVASNSGNPGVNGSIQTLHKKNSVRNSGDILKRSREYELSQDLLEKQIELLERKYGGVKARNAAITIQRAFRHYMMVKKFASITAMAKAEKRLSRRMMMVSSPQGAGVIGEDGPPSNSSSSAYGSGIDSQTDTASGDSPQSQQQQLLNQQQQPRVCATITAGPPGSHSSNRIPPTRSMSLRERRQLESGVIPRSVSSSTSPMPPNTCWSQSPIVQGASSISANSSHPHVNLLHASEQHYYSTPSQCQSQPSHYYVSNQNHQPSVSHDLSFNSSSSHLDSSINSSWASYNSPHTPYYTAQQIYMRPKGHVVGNTVKRVPPEVPKRTSSITSQQQQMRQTPPPPPPSSLLDSSTRHLRPNGLCKTSENGSLTSVQSSGSDSSAASAERIANCDLSSDRSNSPQTWKRGNNLPIPTNQFTTPTPADHIMLISSHQATSTVGQIAGVTDECTSSSHTSAAQYEQQQSNELSVTTSQNYKVSETIRKRQYRVGLNLFNKKPEKGITYLIRRGFLENTPQGVARFLISRKGLSRQMIGEYLGNLQNPFNMAVLECFAGELDLSGMQVDVALRKFQAYFRMPGEAQKIERLMEVYSQRYCACNSDIVARLRSSDTVFVLAFAIIMLNTDLHTPNIKPERRMKVDDFIKNLRGIDDCHDIDRDMLVGIYERVKANEFKPGSDHVTQVMKVQATIVGKKPNLALPHRRLVCYCRLYEIPDVNKKERPGVHQREVFLFNDLLVITKIFSKKKSSVTYTFRNSYPLCGMVVTLLDVSNYPYCIRLSQKVDNKVLVTFNARNEHDRCKFAEDLRESISEMDEMEALRIEAELDRQKSARVGNRAAGSSENRDSGVADVEVCPCPFQSSQGNDSGMSGHESSTQLKRSALSNSLLDMHEQFGNDKPQRRGSVGSLDSGMSISFQSTTASSASRENAAAVAVAANAAATAAKMRFVPNASPVTVNIGGNIVNAGISGQQQHHFSQPHQFQQQHHHHQHHHHHHQLVSTSSNSSTCSSVLSNSTIHYQQQPPPTNTSANVILTGHQPQLPQQQSPSSLGSVLHQGRTQRERKHSRSDESGRSTEV